MKTFIKHDVPKLQRIDSPAGRVYATPTGEKYPSVTSVVSLLTSHEIAKWRQRVGEQEASRISTKASKRGTSIHSLCEEFLLGKNPVPSIIDHEMFKSLVPVIDNIDNIHCLETQLFSHHLQVAGTVDCIGEFEGKMSVIDFKTSSRPKSADMIDHYFMQTSAYAVMFEELTGIPVPNLVIIMGVDDHDPIVFKEKRNRWINDFKELRQQYKQVKNI